MEMQDVDMMRKYYSDEAWEAWKHHYKDWPPDEWRALYKDIIAAIGSDPKGPVAPALRPMALDRSGRKSSAGGSHRHDQSLGDEELKRDALDALSRRREWPDGMRRYIASLYELDVDTWQRVTGFIGRAATIGVTHAGGADSPRSLA